MSKLIKRLEALERGLPTDESVNSDLYMLALADWTPKNDDDFPELDVVLDNSFRLRRQAGDTQAESVGAYRKELIKSIPGTGSELTLMVVEKYRSRPTFD